MGLDDPSNFKPAAYVGSLQDVGLANAGSDGHAAWFCRHVVPSKFRDHSALFPIEHLPTCYVLFLIGWRITPPAAATAAQPGPITAVVLTRDRLLCGSLLRFRKCQEMLRDREIAFSRRWNHRIVGEM
jgi:hypothetical protein